MKKFLISIFTLMFIVSMLTVVNAASGSITATPSANQVVKGNTFTVIISGSADANITALQAALSYDTTKLSLESKSAGTGFSDLSTNSEIAILSTDDTSLSTSGTLYTLTFKVLDTASEGTATITFSSATLALVNSSSEKEDVSVSDATATVTIKSDDTTAGNNNNSTSSDDGNNANGTNDTPSSGSKKSSSSGSSSKSSSSNSSGNSSSKTTLPQTGSEIVSVIVIAVLGVFAVISYVSYKKYKNI